MHKQKIFDWTLKIFLFLSPIFFFRAYQLSFARGLFFVLGTFALFGIALSIEPKRKFSNVWIALFILLAFIRIFFNENFGNPEADWFNFWLSCAGFIYVFCGVLLFYVVYCYADNIETYLKPIVYVCILNFLLTSVQLMNKDFMWTHTPSICGFMETSSQLGQYSALTLPIMAYIHPALAIFPLFTLFASKSISPILAAGIGMAFLGGFNRRNWKIKAGVGVLLIILGLFNLGLIKAKFQCRPVMWQKTLKIALQRPYLGWGYQSFQEKVTEIKGKSMGSREFSRAHNDYFHTAQELGFPIVIIISIFFFNLFKKFIKVKKDKLIYCLAISVLIVLINMSGQTLIRYSSVASPFIVLLALLCIKIDKGEQTLLTKKD